MSDRDQSYLEDMLGYAQDAIALLGEADAVALATDMRSQYAVIRAVEVVGEAVSKVSAERREEISAVPWRQVIGMRNVLIHGYRGMDLTLLVETVRNDFPPLVEQLKTVLGDPSA